VKHRLFNLAAVLSLLLCLVTGALWMRSYAIGDALGCLNSKYYVASSRGRVCFVVLHNQPFPNPFNREVVQRREFVSYWQSPVTLRTTVLEPTFAFAGFSSTRCPRSWVDFVVPMWFVVLVGTLAPGIWVSRYRRARANGACPTCGYALRATPERCPECGAVPAVK